jgi:hypothetical protein
VSGQHLETDAFACQVMYRIDKMTQIATETIQFPHHERIPLPQRFQAGG